MSFFFVLYFSFYRYYRYRRFVFFFSLSVSLLVYCWSCNAKVMFLFADGPCSRHGCYTVQCIFRINQPVKVHKNNHQTLENIASIFPSCGDTVKKFDFMEIITVFHNVSHCILNGPEFFAIQAPVKSRNVASNDIFFYSESFIRI